jgi:transcriptional regulator with XRE-family HTH domain
MDVALRALSQRIHAERKSLGLNQHEFADLVGAHRGSVVGWETRVRVPDRSHMEVFARLFGWTEEESAELALVAQRASVELAAITAAKAAAKADEADSSAA